MRWSRKPTGLSHPRYATRSPILGRRFKLRRSRVETGAETRSSSTVQGQKSNSAELRRRIVLRQNLILSLAKTSSDSLRSTEIRQSVHRSKTPSLVGGRATGIVRPSALRGHKGVATEDGERAGWAAELDL